MNDRRRELLNLLVNSNIWLSGREIAEVLSVSDRTVRSDISSLNEGLSNIDIQINSDTSKGYRLSEESKLILLKEKHRIDWLNDRSPIPRTPEEREAYILYKLIFNDEYQTMEELSEQLYVSKTTVYLDLRKLLDKYQSFTETEIEISNLNGLKISGTEIGKRLMISDALKDFDRYTVTFDKSFYYATNLDPETVEEELIELYELMINALNKYECSMVDQDLVLLTKEIYIALKRHQAGYSLETTSLEQQVLLKVVKDLSIEIEMLLGCSIPLGEKKYLQFCFNSKRLLALGADLGSGNYNREGELIVDTFISQILENYEIDLDLSESFRENMLLHMRPMLLRVKSQIEDRNPVIDQIKIKYPFAYEISTQISPVIYQKIGYWINETELSYITLHVAVALNDIFSKKNILIVCGSGFATAKLIKSELLSRYSTYINRIQHVSYSRYENMKSIDEDVIVSTIPLNHFKNNQPVVVVNPILTYRDILNLDAIIKNDSYEDNDIKKRLLRYFPKTLFKRELGVNMGYEDILRDMSKTLKEEEYIENEDRFYQSVLEREKLYSTILSNNLAIPHPMTSMSSTSVVSVCLLPNQITYEGKKISAILLFSINSKESDYLNDLYYFLKIIVKSEEISKKIRYIKDYKSFINAIIKEDEKQ